MLTYYPRDNSVEMYDPKNRRPFLKRCEYADIAASDLYIGATVTICARQLKVVEYADNHTKKKLDTLKANTLAMIKPDAYNQIGQILSFITHQSSGLVVSRLKMIRMDQDSAAAFANMQDQGDWSPEQTQLLLSDVTVVMELIGTDAAGKWRNMMQSIRDQLGCDAVSAVHGSKDTQKGAMEVDFFFGAGKNWPHTALFNNCTLCIVKPHAFASSGGKIISRILAEGFEISAMALFNLDKSGAEEFIDVYKGVLPEYQDMVLQFVAGACLVMEIRQEDAVNSFRKLVGPHDPEVAKHLRPDTLRAEHGLDRVRNAVHCTDLPEDGLLEVEYFFNILYGRK
jgi:nucleoside-diphosphate kinase